jgi:hypothetical protein
MKRRVCWAILASAFCLTGLPGCALTDHLLYGDGRPKDPPAGEGVQVRQGHYPGLEAAEPKVIAPPRPERTSEPIPGAPLPANAVEAPTGRRVPEVTGPPLVSLAKPLLLQPMVLTQTPLEGPSQPPVQPPPAAPQEPVVAALSCLLKKQLAEALTQLQRYDPATQELLMRLLPAVVLLSDKGVDQLAPAEAAALQEQVQQVLVALRNRTGLVIDKMCLCENISGFGQFKALPEGHAFQAGTSRQAGDWVQIYVELRNIASEQQGNYYATSLNGTVSLNDGQGKPVWTYNYRQREQPLRSSMPRSDCYRAYDFYVPAVPPGRYTLTFEVVDETRQPQRTAKRSVEFVVAGP